MAPTPGRVVWFWPAAGSPIPHVAGIPLAALVAFVTTERLVNLAVFDATGAIWPQQDVQLVHEGDVYVSDAARCEWMPYQVDQAKAAAGKAESPCQTPITEIRPVPYVAPTGDPVEAQEGLLKAQGVAT